MKFKVIRKINLSNIDKDLWPYETEDLGAEDADSFEEAARIVDGYVRERQGYYRAISEQRKASRTPAPAMPPTTGGPIPAPFTPASSVTPSQPAPVQTPMSGQPIQPPQPITPEASVTSNVPKEFQI